MWSVTFLQDIATQRYLACLFFFQVVGFILALKVSTKNKAMDTEHKGGLDSKSKEILDSYLTSSVFV